jgi:hypothetical protein
MKQRKLLYDNLKRCIVPSEAVDDIEDGKKIRPLPTLRHIQSQSRITELLPLQWKEGRSQ